MNTNTLKNRIGQLGGVTQAAKTLGVSRQIIYIWLKNGVSKYGVLLIQKALKEKRSRGTGSGSV